MIRLIACMVALAICLGTASRAQETATALPLRLEVDLSAIHDIEAHPDLPMLETLVKSVLERRVRKKLWRHWFIQNGTGISRLVLTVNQAGPNLNFFIDLEFFGDTNEIVSFIGRPPTSLPRQRQTFDAELVNALFEFFGKRAADIEAASTGVHSETDDGLKTVLHLDRPLDETSQIFYYSHKLKLTWDHIGAPITVKKAQDGHLMTYMLLNAGQTRSGTITPDVKQAVAGDLPLARFCVHRPQNDDPPAGAKPVVAIDCPLAGTCALREALPQRWADQNCEIPINFVPEEPRWAWGAAYAAEPDTENWNVPELEVLYDRVENFPGRFVGFTEFTIRVDALGGLDADSYTAWIVANGIPIRINGMQPEARENPFDPDYGLIYRFGVENLKFAGRADGCEDLSVALQFYKDGEPTGDQVFLERGYAALRHAPERRFETEYGLFSWEGTYVAPGNRNENGIFIASALFPLDDPEKERDALDGLNDRRNALDALNLRISARDLGLGLGLESVLSERAADIDLALVGKMRPPRTVRENGDVAYGLLVGVEEPSGQLQFTFDRAQVRALQRFLDESRASDAEARSLIPARNGRTVFGYSEARRIAPDWVCQK